MRIRQFICRDQYSTHFRLAGYRTGYKLYTHLSVLINCNIHSQFHPQTQSLARALRPSGRIYSNGLLAIFSAERFKQS